VTLIVATSVRASNAWSGQVSVGYSETLRQLTRARRASGRSRESSPRAPSSGPRPA
jgi:hypothetical protein